MPIFAQAVEPVTQIVDHAFKISPESVFGWLTAGMVFIILALSAAIVYQYHRGNKRNDESSAKYELLAQNAITVIVNNSAAVGSLKEMLAEVKNATPDQIQTLENKLLASFQRCEDGIRNALDKIPKR
jgi:hypothetical protein